MAGIFNDDNRKSALQAFLTPTVRDTAVTSNNNSLFGGAMRAGWNNLQAVGGAAVGAVGDIVASDALKNWGIETALSNQAEARATGRPDLDVAPWEDGGAGVIPWALYQTLSQGPQMAAQLVGGKVLGTGLRKAGLPLAPKGLEEIGKVVPRALGGGGAKSMALADAAATKAGKDFAETFVGATVAGYPMAVGSMYEQAIERGDPNAGDAVASMLMAPAYAALDAIQPTALKGLLKRGQEGRLMKRVLTGAFVDAASEGPQEAVQTAMELSFRPDISPAEKMRMIVKAAVTGGVVGGVLGGVGGVKAGARPDAVATTDLKKATDILKPEAPTLELQGEVDRSGTLGPAAPEVQGPPAPSPYANEPVEAISKRLADLDRRMFATAQSGTAVPTQDVMLRDRLRAELEARSVPAETQIDPAAGQREGPAAPARVIEPEAVPVDDGRVFGRAAPQVAPEVAPAAPGAAVDPTTLALPLEMPGATTPFQMGTSPTTLPEQLSPRLAAEREVEQTAATAARETESKRAADEKSAKTLADARSYIETRATGDKPLSSKAKDAIAKVEAREPAEAVNYIRNYFIDPGASYPTWVERAGKRMGLIDAQGMPQTVEQMDQRVAEAQATYNTALQKVGLVNNAENAAQLERAQKTFTDLREARGVRVDADERFEHAQRAKRPPKAAPGRAMLRTAPGQFAPVSVSEAPPTRQPGGKMFYQVTVPATTNAEGRAVPETTVRVPAADLYPLDESKLIQAEPNTAVAPPGFAPDPVEPAVPSIPTNRSYTSTQTTPITPLQDYTPVGEIARPLETASEQPANNLGFGQEDAGEARTAYFQKYEALAQDILATKKLRGPTRRLARTALDGLQRGTPDMEDRVNAMLAAYSTETGEMLFSMTGETKPQTVFGEIVYEVNGARLESAPNPVNGQIDYFVYTPNGGRISAYDITSSSGMSELDVYRIRKAMVREQAYDQKMSERYPDGPFTNALDNLVATPSVPAAHVSYVKGLLEQVGLGNVRVFLHTPQDVKNNKDLYKYYGRYSAVEASTVLDTNTEAAVSWMGPNSTDWAFMVRPEALTNPYNAVETLAHEVGHIVRTTMLNHADTDTYNAIHKEHEAWVAKTKGKDLAGVIKILRNRYASERAGRDRIGEGETVLDPYWTSFDEFFADGVSKWATTSAKPLTLVDKFFSQVAKLMRKLAEMVYGNAYEAPAAIKKFMDANVARAAQEKSRPLPRAAFGKRPSVPAGMSRSMAMRVGTAEPQPKEVNRRLRNFVQWADKKLLSMEATPLTDAGDTANKYHLFWSTVQHITQMFKSLFPDGILGQYGDSHRQREALEARVVALLTKANHALEDLEKSDPKTAQATRKLMAASFRNTDVRKAWEAQPWLHTEPNADVLRGYVKEMNDIYNQLKRDGKHTVYDNLVASNETGRFMEQAVSLYNLAMVDAGVPQDFKDKLVDPMTQFIADPAAFEDINFANAYWKDQVTQVLASVKEMSATQRGLTGAMDKKLAKPVVTMADTMDKRTKEIDRQLAAMAMAPYFHIGRFGNHFVAFKLKARTDGTPDPDDMERIAAAMEKEGFDHIEMPTEATKARAYVRFETIAEATRFEDLVKRLRDQGLLDPDPNSITAGERKQDYMQDEPVWAQRLQEHLNAVYETFEDTDMTAEQKQTWEKMRATYRSSLRQFFLEMTPDTSLLKVNLRRDRVPGFSADMQRAYAFRTHVGARAIANMYAAPKLSNSLTLIKDSIQQAQIAKPGENTVDARKRRGTMQNVLNELVKREADRPSISKNTFIDKWRAVNHAWFLGMSPSYVIVNLTQLGITLWPELSKKHGFIKAAKAMAKITPMAVRIMAATMAEAKSHGMKRAWDGTITAEVLKRANVTGADAKFILRTANSGLFDMGSQSRELGRIIDNNEDSKTELGLRIASAAGYYSEMMSRLIAGMAARELHGDDKTDLDAYVNTTINEAMFNYSNYNTARATGRLGVLGPATPVAAAFMQYTMQLIQKLYREVNSAFMDVAKTPAEKKEARRFLGAHLAAVTALAGTMGMPLASVFAIATNKMVDILGDDDEPFDAKIAYRNFLADMMGPEVANVIARGLPQAMGFDVSARAGEADLLPFSRFMADRRSWKDAAKDLALDTAGSPVSMVLGLLNGASMIAEGDVMAGAVEATPSAIKGPLKAFDMYDDGYKDKSGNKIPMDAGAMDIMWQLIGFKPAKKANYDEAKYSDQAVTGQMTKKATLLRKQIVTALESGDQAGARELLKEAQQWDFDNPDNQITPTISGTLTRRAKARAEAKVFGAPLGVGKNAAERFRFLGGLN